MANTRAKRRADPGARAESALPTSLNAVPSGTKVPKADAGDEDSLLHHRLRLGIVSALAGSGPMTFVDLRSLLKTTDGNLSVHARKLEDAGYIRCTKSFADRRPHSEYRLESPGRKALERYLDHMQALIEAARNSLAR